MKQPSLAPKLRHRILIQRNDYAQDTDGSVVDNWVDFSEDVPAEIMPMSGREFVAAQSVQVSVDTRITVRDLVGLTADMRILHENRIYNIKAVLPDPTFRRHLTVMAQSGVNDG